MTLRDFLKLLRTRWLVIAVAVAAALVCAVAVNVFTTPIYEAKTRLFVSTTSGDSMSDVYQGNRFSQERVVSYTELLMGQTLAQRTIEKLGLDMSPEELRDNVTAGAKADTVLIDVAVTDPSPVRARDIADALSDEFVLMVRELETPEDGTRPDARVIVEQRAVIPEDPVSPKKSRNLAVALLLGLVAGVGLAYVRDQLDNTVKDLKELEAITGVGVVGSIPMDKERRRRPSISFDTDNSTFAESFRKLRTNLQFLAVDNPPRVIVVTSSLPHEGKSTTAINLALALSENDYSVALVDGDLRRPMLHAYLGLPGSSGFSTVLAGRASLDEVLQETAFSRVSVLASGSVPPNPSELLGSMAAQKVLAELRDQFDYVILDSSPLLAVTDAAILAAAADGVLTVARYGGTKRDQLSHAVGNLRSVGAPLLGAVLTMTPPRGGATYSYSYSGRGDDVRPLQTSEERNGPLRRLRAAVIRLLATLQARIS